MRALDNFDNATGPQLKLRFAIEAAINEAGLGPIETIEVLGHMLALEIADFSDPSYPLEFATAVLDRIKAIIPPLVFDADTASVRTERDPP
jgi:hypothetical protein